MFNVSKMKLSIVGIAAFSSVGLFAAGVSEILTKTAPLVTSVAKEIASGSVKSAADLVNRRVGSVALSQVEANTLYSAALPIANILRSASPALLSAYDQNADQIAKVVAAKALRPSVAAEVIAASLKQGIASAQQIEAGLSEASVDIGNRILSVRDANMNPTAFLEQYKAITPDFQRLLSTGMSEQLRRKAVSLLIQAMTVRAEAAAVSEDPDRYISLARLVMERMAAIYGNDFSEEFAVEILKGFEGDVAKLDYLLGTKVSLEVIEQDMQAGKPKSAAKATSSFALDLDTDAVTTVSVPESTARLDSCFRTGRTDAAGECSNGVCTTAVPVGLR